ncbi:hypothetical protein [Rhizocola hellebori]|nr:hypothetical protein [Rhizocola hellebori]
MSDAAFVLRVGAGLYMDSNGMIRTGPDPALPTYTVPGGLPVSPDSVKKVFDGIASAMPDPKDPETREKLGRLGVLDDTMKILHDFGKIASTIGKVIGMVGFAVDVAKLLGLLKDGPSAVEQLIEKRYKDLDRRLEGMEIRWQQQDLRNLRVDISNSLSAVDSYLEELRMGVINPANLQVKLQDMRNTHTMMANATGRMLHPSTWLAGFKRADYERVWPWVPWPELHRMPVGIANPNLLQPQNHARFLDHAELVFDHRAMVPGASYAALSYLTLIKAISPEYRSTGEFDDYLVRFADALEALVATMRDTGIARTIHVDGNFGPLGEDEVEDPLIGLPRVGKNCFRFTVGAMDLRSHTNDVWDAMIEAAKLASPMPPRPWTAGPLAQMPDRAGPMWMRWTPPARLERAQEPLTNRTIYEITNKDECIAAANAQAERDYTDVLFGSGYFNLVHLVATLRHNATEPNRSETVTGRTYLSHLKSGSSKVTVTGKVVLSEIIAAQAERRTQITKAGVDVTTQPPGRQRPLEYRVMLRTVPSFVLPSHWMEPDYSEVQRASYVEKTVTDLDGTPHKTMALQLDTAEAMSEVELFKGRPDARVRKAAGRATLKAHTFDWWIPVRPLPAEDAWIKAAGNGLYREALGAAAGAGGNEGTGGNGSKTRMPQASEYFDYDGEISLGSGAAVLEAAGAVSDDVDPLASGGQHREVRLAEDLELSWELTWVGDRMSVRLRSREQDRNYVVFLVIAEKLGPSGQWLHTAFKVPLNNQLTFVPQDFFDRERAAMGKASKTLKDFNDRYSPSAPNIGPKAPGPMAGVISPVLMNSAAGLERALQAAGIADRQLLRETLRANGLHDFEPETDPDVTQRIVGRAQVGP